MIKVNKIKKGDKIAVVSLSKGTLGEAFVKHCLDIGVRLIAEMGFELVMMPNTLKGMEVLASNPSMRADDLKNAFADSSIKGIVCAIGGNDTCHTLKYLMNDADFIKSVKENPKVFLGFSDSTVNHFMFYKMGLNTFYGQSFLTEFCELEGKMLPYSKANFLALMTGEFNLESSGVWYEERTDFSTASIGVSRAKHDENKGYEVLAGSGKHYGKLLGGCIETMYRLVEDCPCKCKGVNDEFSVFPTKKQWENKIMFIETAEVEAGTTPILYREMIKKFKVLGLFEVINGLIVGKPQNEVYYDEFKQILVEELLEYNFPILYNINFGHALPRAIIPYNIEVCLDIDNKSISFVEDIFND